MSDLPCSLPCRTWTAIAVVIVLVCLTEPASAQQDEYERTGHTLADLMKMEDSPGLYVPGVPRSTVDEARAAAEGIRKIASQRLILFTDLPYDPQIEELPAIFDQAFPIWCDYFSIDPSQHPTWHMTGCLMKDGDRFRRAGLLPDHLPPFRNGFSVNYDLWVYEQETPYYRRHLVLHEGTHGFMNTILKSCGPPWYMEGIAELLGTHQWKDGRLQMGIMPKSRDDVPGWGRVRKIQDLFAEGMALSLEEVLHFSGTAHQQNEAYAWSWAAAALLDFHPRYQQRFRSLSRSVQARDFNDQFRKLFADDWETLAEEWQVFVGDLEYGYEVPPMALDLSPGSPLESGWKVVHVDATRGWQNTGIQLAGGAIYEVRAKGRYQVANQPVIWWCEPGGVTIRYYHGQPLGVLLAAVRPDDPKDNRCVFLQPETIGLGTTLPVEASGTLFLRINDSAAELGDNAGSLDVAIRPAE